MTAANPNPAGDPTPGAGQGAEPGGLPSADASGTEQQGSEGRGATGSGNKDFLERVRREPEFAIEQVRRWQSEADSREAKLRETEKWLGKLGDLKDNFTGDDIRAYLEQYDRVLGHPKLKTAIEKYLQTGQIPSNASSPDGSEGDEDDLYLSDEQKEIRALKQELQDLKGQVGQVDHSATVTRLTGHFEKVANDLHLSGEPFGKVKDAVLRVVEAWAKKGDIGRQALRALQGPNGEKEVRRLMVQQIDELGLSDDLALARLRAKKGALAGLTTDGPGGVASRGDEPMPEHKTALEALRAARANPEKLEGFGY